MCSSSIHLFVNLAIDFSNIIGASVSNKRNTRGLAINFANSPPYTAVDRKPQCRLMTLAYLRFTVVL
jgi:hypothetical protein